MLVLDLHQLTITSIYWNLRFQATGAWRAKIRIYSKYWQNQGFWGVQIPADLSRCQIRIFNLRKSILQPKLVGFIEFQKIWKISSKIFWGKIFLKSLTIRKYKPQNPSDMENFWNVFYFLIMHILRIKIKIFDQLK